MRLAYIISAYKLPDLLIRLVHRLQFRDATFLVHVDRKTDRDVFEEMRDGLRCFSNVRFLKRHNCHWGDFGHVRATLKGIDELLGEDIPFDYTMLLTGQHYPLRASSSIESFLSRSNGNSFMEFFSLPTENWKTMGMDRIEQWQYRFRGKQIRLPLDTHDGRLLSIKKLINFLIPRKRAFLPGLRPYGGSSYWCLSKEAILYIHDYVNRNPDFVRFFNNTFVPDELFFQTLLMNSRLKNRIINDNLMYADWSGGQKHPAILREGDFRALSSSGKKFARKFDTSVDSRILDMIDRDLLSMIPNSNLPDRYAQRGWDSDSGPFRHDF